MRAIPTVRERARTLARGGRSDELLLSCRRCSTRRPKRSSSRPRTPRGSPRLSACYCRSATWDETTLEAAVTGWLDIEKPRHQGRRSAGARRADRPHASARASTRCWPCSARTRACRGSIAASRCVARERRAALAAAAIGLSPAPRRLPPRPGVLGVVPAGELPARRSSRSRSSSGSLRWSGGFSATWRELDVEAQRYRGTLLAHGRIRHAARGAVRDRGHHPDAAGVLRRTRAPTTRSCGRGCSTRKRSTTTRGIKLAKYDELYGYAWWAFTRIGGYVLLPFPALEVHLPQGQPARHGAARRGFFEHAWIYGAVPGVRAAGDVAGRRASPTSAPTIRFTRAARAAGSTSSSWEAMYFAQFFALEMFFRGLLARRAAQALRLGRDLRDGRAVLHDPLRQAVPRSERRDRRGHRAR